MLPGPTDWPSPPPDVGSWTGWEMPSRYFWAQNNLYFLSRKRPLQVTGFPIFLTHQATDSNNVIHVRMQWNAGEGWESATIPLPDLYKAVPKALLASGMPLAKVDLTKRFLVEWYLKNSERLLPMPLVTQGGWMDPDHFVWGHTVLSRDRCVHPHAVDITTPPFKRWMEFQPVHPQATAAEWAWWQKDVLPQAPHLVLGLGVIGAALLLHLVDQPGFLFHIVDDTSTGKTTSFFLLASILGNPHKSEGLIQPWNLRQKDLIRWIYWMRDSVWFIDDATPATSTFQPKAYLMADGNTPGYPEGTRGVILSSSEHYPSPHGGVAARTILWPESLLPFGVPVEAWRHHVFDHPETWGWGWPYLMDQVWAKTPAQWQWMWRTHNVERESGVAQRWQNHWNLLWCGIHVWFPFDSGWVGYFQKLEHDWWDMYASDKRYLRNRVRGRFGPDVASRTGSSEVGSGGSTSP